MFNLLKREEMPGGNVRVLINFDKHNGEAHFVEETFVNNELAIDYINRSRLSYIRWKCEYFRDYAFHKFITPHNRIERKALQDIINMEILKFKNLPMDLICAIIYKLKPLVVEVAHTDQQMIDKFNRLVEFADEFFALERKGNQA